MFQQVKPIELMVQELSKLPGIGKKSAQRLAYHIVSMPAENVRRLANAILEGRQNIRFCEICGNYSVEPLCDVCSNDARNRSMICVVRDPRDVAAMERVQDYKGLYHVLHGVLSPMDNIGPSDLNIKSLLTRLSDGEVK